MLSSSTHSTSLVSLRGAKSPLRSALAELTRGAALSLACLAGLAGAAAAQAGGNDPTFNLADNGTFGDGTNGTVHAVALQADGKALIAGSFSLCNGVTRNRVARLGPDGSLDPAFDPAAGANDVVRAIAVQPDGKLLIGGLFTDYGGTAINRVARVNADGSLDTSFNQGTGPAGSVFALVVQPDGKVLIGGDFTSYDGAARNRIARLNSDGTLDVSFAPGLGANGTATPQVLTLALQPDGKALIGGNFTSYNGTARSRIARLNTDGSLDTSFNPGTGAGVVVSGDPTVHSITVQPDGKVLIGGDFTQYHGTPRNRLARLNPNGLIDTSFDPGVGASGSVLAMVLQPDGRLLIAGTFGAYNSVGLGRIARVNANGSLDTGFGSATEANEAVRAFALQPDGKLLIGGDFTSYDSIDRSYAARLNANGSLDASFNPGAGANRSILAMVRQPDGKLLIGGVFTSFNGAAIRRVARLTAEGSLDTSFNPDLSSSSSRVRAIAVQPDGKVILGGSVSPGNSSTISGIARLNADGSADTSFVVGQGPSADVFAIALQPDGKILIGGQFGFVSGVSAQRIARLNANGTLDTSFNPGSGASGGGFVVEAVELQPDGKVLIAGSFATVNGTPRSGVARLNANGSLDTTFNPGTGASGPPPPYFLTVDNLALQPDGRMLIGGTFTNYNGTAINRIARLNADGSLDASFNPGLGADAIISASVLQQDGKLLIGGSFATYDGAPRAGIARVNSDGSLDSSFAPGVGVGGIAFPRVSALALQPNGKVFLGGNFTAFDGVPRHRIARAFTVAPGVTTSYCTAGTSAIGCTPTMSASGVASAAATSGYVVTTSNIEGQRQTNTFYSLLGPKTPATPFGAGLLCVKAPTQRIGSVQASGTPGLCDGTVSIDVLAWAQTHPNGQGVPYTAGTTLDFQCAIRDPLSPGTRVMSDALQVTLLP